MSGLLHIPSGIRARQLRASKTCQILQRDLSDPQWAEDHAQAGHCRVRMMTNQRSRTSRSLAEWGGWGSNPRPADYESARRPFRRVRERSDLGKRTFMVPLERQ